jgi:hypothetical protein
MPDASRHDTAASNAAPLETTCETAAAVRVDWCFAILCAPCLTIVFAVQHWLSRAGLTLAASLTQQATIYRAWLAPFGRVERTGQIVLARSAPARWSGSGDRSPVATCSAWCGRTRDR